MTLLPPLPIRLTKIDQLVLPNHYHLTESDDCYFWGEYTARGGFAYSKTNQLILNLKKEPDRQGRPEWRHKGIAINEIAREFASTLDPEWLQTVTLVPVPPSKCVDDPMYDDRMLQVLRRINPKANLDIRELVIQPQNRNAAHLADGGGRLSPDELIERYTIDNDIKVPIPTTIAIVDDVIVSGASYRAMDTVLRHCFPEAYICGIFVARRNFS